MKVACHRDPNSRRSVHIAECMAAGVRACGHRSMVVDGFAWAGADVGIAYGWANPALFQEYRSRGGHFVYVDLGWWDRKPLPSLLDGFHKVVVDGREPGAYFRGNFATDRFARQGLTVAPWRAFGNHVLLAGMSAKSAGTRGLAPMQWELATIEILRQVTARPVIYRPKPSWAGAQPIPGTIYSPPDQPLKAVLKDCWMAVTMHSNVAVDALLAGVPVNVAEGVAREFSTPLVEIDAPCRPDGREQLMADIAWQQWSPAEMRSGACFRYLLERTPLCA